MTSAQVVETSVTNNSSFQNYSHPDDHTIRTTEQILLGSNHLLAQPNHPIAPGYQTQVSLHADESLTET